MKLVSACGLAALVWLATEQPQTPAVLRVGDARINARLLRPYKVRWKETLVDVVHKTNDRGTWDDELRREVLGDREVITRSIVVTLPDGTIRERLKATVDGATFAPIRSEWKSTNASYEYDFAGLGIQGVRVNEAGATPQKIKAGVWQPAFDYYGGMMELFLATLPRVAGGVFSFPAATATIGPTAPQDSIHWPLVEVIGEDVTRGAGGALVKAWRVEANTRYGFYKVWVTDMPPHVVRTVLLLPPGGRITLELM